jgi:NAD(P)-dependent dehydrogenase (short-subunit alcohol dehydrogenase family)
LRRSKSACDFAILVAIGIPDVFVEDGSGGALYMNRSSRTALNQVIKSLSIDLYEQGISVASVSPGWVKTDSGGEGALIDAETSVSGIKKVIEKLDMSQTARFCDYKGEAIAW